jgi:hypothetical protein
MALNVVVGGIYSPQPLPSRLLFLLAMGAPDSPMAHRTLHCSLSGACHICYLLGFGAVDRWRLLSSSDTGQSGGTPDMSGDLRLLRGTVHHCLSVQSTVDVQRVVAPLAHRTVWCTPDSPVNYSGACSENS